MGNRRVPKVEATPLEAFPKLERVAGVLSIRASFASVHLLVVQADRGAHESASLARDGDGWRNAVLGHRSFSRKTLPEIPDTELRRPAAQILAVEPGGDFDDAGRIGDLVL
jgi:hypothetical protein